MSQIYEIADGIYRIATFVPESPITYTQFLIKDEKSLLFHTGPRALFSQTFEAIKRVTNPAGIHYISWSHLEGDECGAVNEFLQVAPEAEPVASVVGVMLSVSDFFSRRVKGMNDGEMLDLGHHKLRFLITPHVPHCWDATLVFEETTGTLLASDLFAHMGETRPITDNDIVEQALAMHKKVPDYLPIGPHIARVFGRLEALRPRVLAGHHAPAFAGNVVQALKDLRTGLFKMTGKE